MECATGKSGDILVCFKKCETPESSYHCDRLCFFRSSQELAEVFLLSQKIKDFIK